MRLRHIPGAEQMIEETPHVVHGAKEKKGTWQQIFGNDHPIRIEVVWVKVSLFWSRRPATRM